MWDDVVPINIFNKLQSGEKEPPVQVCRVHTARLPLRQKKTRQISDFRRFDHEMRLPPRDCSISRKAGLCSAVALPRMLALAHRWVQTYEQAAAVAVAAPGGAQAPGDAPRDAPARRVAPQLLAKAVDDRDAQEAGPQDPPQLAA
jgi:hypothetical protein